MSGGEALPGAPYRCRRKPRQPGGTRSRPRSAFALSTTSSAELGIFDGTAFFRGDPGASGQGLPLVAFRADRCRREPSDRHLARRSGHRAALHRPPDDQHELGASEVGGSDSRPSPRTQRGPELHPRINLTPPAAGLSPPRRLHPTRRARYGSSCAAAECAGRFGRSGTRLVGRFSIAFGIEHPRTDFGTVVSRLTRCRRSCSCLTVSTDTAREATFPPGGPAARPTCTAFIRTEAGCAPRGCGARPSSTVFEVAKLADSPAAELSGLKQNPSMPRETGQLGVPKSSVAIE